MRHKLPLISIEYVSKAYGDDYLNYDQIVLRNVSLTIQQGEFVIIFGPSGSGKSTLLNVMAGLERPTAGRIKIRSQDLTTYDDVQLAKYHRLKMGMVFQSFNLIKSLSVWENVALPQTAEGVPIGRRKRRAKHLLKMFGIDQYMDRHPNELSGGEQQRVAIARALVNNPLLLLVDEPTGNLDSKSADDVMRIFHDLHYHSKHTIVLVTHNPDYLQFASRIIHIQDGAVSKQEWNEHNPAGVEKILPDTHLETLKQYKDATVQGEAFTTLRAEIHPTDHAQTKEAKDGSAKEATDHKKNVKPKISLHPDRTPIESGLAKEDQPYQRQQEKEAKEAEEAFESLVPSEPGMIIYHADDPLPKRKDEDEDKEKGPVLFS